MMVLDSLYALMVLSEDVWHPTYDRAYGKGKVFYLRPRPASWGESRFGGYNFTFHHPVDRLYRSRKMGRHCAFHELAAILDVSRPFRPEEMVEDNDLVGVLRAHRHTRQHGLLFVVACAIQNAELRAVMIRDICIMRARYINPEQKMPSQDAINAAGLAIRHELIDAFDLSFRPPETLTQWGVFAVEAVWVFEEQARKKEAS